MPKRRIVSPSFRRVRRRIPLRTGMTGTMVRRRFFRRVASKLPYIGTAYTAYQGMKFLRNRYKKRRFKRSLGEPVGKGGAKRSSIQNPLSNWGQQDLVSIPLINIFPTTTDELNKRSRDIVNFRGVKICWWMRNVNPDGDPIYVNWAIISPKAEENGLTAIPDGRFFRSSDGNERSKNFGTNLTWIDSHCSPINTDLYHVHTHKRFVVNGVFNNGDSAPTNTNAMVNVGRKGQHMIEKYLPINRQIRFGNGNTETRPQGGNVFLVFWYQDTSEQTGSMAQFGYQITQFFREPKN